MSLKIPEPVQPKHMQRAAIEIGFIVFLFYANLLMGEFTRSHVPKPSLGHAVRDVFTATNFAIAVVAAMLGHAVFEFLRRRL
jgi:hypothetical protein